VRNNVSQPGIGHVIMFAAATVGWTVLFVITLLSHAPGGSWWIKIVFSGLLMVASAVFAVLLWRRVPRDSKGPGSQGRSAAKG